MQDGFFDIILILCIFQQKNRNLETNLDTRTIIDLVASRLVLLEEITAAGLSGEVDAAAKPGENDIDIFVFCKEIPCREERQLVYEQFLNQSLISDLRMNVYAGGYWGIGDCFCINGVETWLMFFTTKEIRDYLEEVLTGNLLDDDNGFYPTGRCATLMNMEVLQDKTGFIDALRQKIRNYPDPLRISLSRHHLDLSLDEEDFERAVSRQDVLFYHQVLETALDHFLQALFAVNRVYFPSRKRTLQYIDGFEIKPERCADRLLRAVELGSRKEGIAESSRIWRDLVRELIELFFEQDPAG